MTNDLKQKLKKGGVILSAILVVALIGGFIVTRVNVAYAAGFISKKTLELRLKQVQFAYDLQTMGSEYHDPEFAQTEKLGILEQMIAERLLLDEAAKQGIVITEEERQTHVIEVIEWIQQEYFENSADLLKQTLDLYQISRSELEAYLTETLAVFKLREARTAAITVTDADAELFYAEHSEHYDIPEMIRVAHILVTDLALAQELLAELKAGANFANLAEENSIDTMSAVMGGDLNWNARGAFVTEFEEAAWALTKSGQLSDIVETEYGYHIIRFVEKLGGRERSYAEVKDLVIDDLTAELADMQWISYMDELRASSRVLVFLR